MSKPGIWFCWISVPEKYPGCALTLCTKLVCICFRGVKIYLYYCAKHHELLQSSLFPLIQGICTLTLWKLFLAAKQCCSLLWSQVMRVIQDAQWKRSLVPTPGWELCGWELIGTDKTFHHMRMTAQWKHHPTAAYVQISPFTWHLLWKYNPCFCKTVLHMSFWMSDTVS